MLCMVMGIEIQIAIGMRGFSVDRNVMINPSSCLVGFVSRKAMEPSVSTLMVNRM